MSQSTPDVTQPDSVRDDAPNPQINVVPETGIVPVERPDPLLYCSVFFVFANILIPSALMNSLLYLLLLGYCVAVPFLWQRRKDLPPWATWMTEPLITRLTTCPSEFILVPAIGVLVISKWLPAEDHQRLREFGLCLLLLCSFWLSNHASLLLSGYRSRLFKFHFLPRQPQQQQQLEESTGLTTLPPYDTSQETDKLKRPAAMDTVTVQRRLWERRQQQRWEDWMQEELTRLDGEAYTKNDEEVDQP